ncbi:unnamed protein product [Symbiodinium natans]|uniref:Uncharacterized protein n=1 Tax=Symbiodinium natans TaxID=878477 RepID=A0A812J622_9DINO|nr:unnamed protein product [Symbiodinium natans]
MVGTVAYRTKNLALFGTVVCFLILLRLECRTRLPKMARSPLPSNCGTHCRRASNDNLVLLGALYLQTLYWAICGKMMMIFPISLRISWLPEDLYYTCTPWSSLKS